MDLLQESRQKINDIDDQLARLFEERMHAVEGVARYKAENNLPVFDASREAANIEANAAKIQDPELKPYFIQWCQQTMNISKEYQKSILKRD